MRMQRHHPSKRKIVPDVVTFFLQKRVKEAIGLGLVVTAIVLSLSLSSYDWDDPSANTAVDGPIQNVFGIWGSYLADFFHQYIMGDLSQLISVLLIVWGGRLLIHRSFSKFRWRFFSCGISLVFLSIGAGILGSSTGIIGTLIISLLKGVYKNNPILIWGFGIGFLSIGAALYLYSLTLSLREWKALLSGINKISVKVVRGFLFVLRKITLFIRTKIVRLEHPAFLRQEPTLSRSASPLPINTPEEERDYYVADSLEESEVKKESLPQNPFSLFSQETVALKRSDDEGETLALSHKEGDYEPPPFTLLRAPLEEEQKTSISKAEMEANALKLKGVLEDFGIRGDVVSVRPGPVVTLYELVPAPGIKSSRIISLADDIARSMSAISARVAVIPGKNAIGIELPNLKCQTVYLRELLSGDDYGEQNQSLSLALGKDIAGNPVVRDLARMPHLLVAGTTGSGKSVSVNAMILSLLFKFTPDQCKFIMIDPKMLELSIYEGIPHLLSPVVTDPKKAVIALKWVVREMENRYRSMSEMGVRNIQGYNARLKEAKEKEETLTRRIQTGFDPQTGKPIFEDQALEMDVLPSIVVVVDEMADLMLVAGKDVEAAIQRLAQMARAAGIHLIMATQRPSVDVITGTIKANFPTRISFQVTSKIDSRTILGEGGAEQLLGQGDMLYMAGGGRIMRVHGPFVSDADVEKVVSFLKSQGAPTYVSTVTEETNEPSILEIGGEGDSEDQALFAQAVDIVRRERKASTSFIQRCLKLGYNRAARLMEQMEKEGIVSQANHVGRREVLIPPLNN